MKIKIEISHKIIWFWVKKYLKVNRNNTEIFQRYFHFWVWSI